MRVIEMGLGIAPIHHDNTAMYTIMAALFVLYAFLANTGTLILVIFHFCFYGRR